MTLVPYASMVEKAALSAPGCPSSVIEGHLRDAAIRTCERTHYHRAMLPSMLLTPDKWVYKFVGMPEGSEVFTLLSSNLNNRNLPVMAPDVFVCCFPDWDGGSTSAQQADALYNSDPYNTSVYNQVMGTFSGTSEPAPGSEPRAISRITPCDFIMLPKPDDAKPYWLRNYVALRPMREASGIDSCIVRDLGEAIVHGALQELLLLPQAHWSNPELGTYHAKQYLFKLTERRARANLGYSKGALVAHPQPFGV